MTETNALFVAFIIHYIFRASIFMDFYNCNCDLWHLPSALVLFGVCIFLSDNQVLPQRYKGKGSPAIHFFIETMICIFAIEVLMSLLWSNVEMILMFLLKETLTSFQSKELIANMSLTGVAFSVFFYSAIVTNNWDKIVAGSANTIKKVQRYFRQIGKIQNDSGAEGDPKCYVIKCSPIAGGCHDGGSKSMSSQTKSESTPKKCPMPKKKSQSAPPTRSASRGAGDQTLKSRNQKRKDGC